MILIDTPALVGALTGRRHAAVTLRHLIHDGSQMELCTIVLYEWWRGPRTREELNDQERLFPAKAALRFGLREAAIAADVYRQLKRPRNRERDIAIAACAIAQNAALWTLNPRDFADIPGLELV